MRPPLLAVSAALLIGACGESEDSKPAAERPPTPNQAAVPASTAKAGSPVYTREQIIEALGVTPGRDENGVAHSDLSIGCFAGKIFVSPADNMPAYQQIGDPVATNRSGNVGVAVGTYAGASESRCLRIFKQRLAALR